ncbi:MAG: response regulator [Isosphaeraceae bacterium]
MAIAVHSIPLRVLVVDDHTTIRIAVRTLLRKLGHQVDVAEDGRTALDVASRSHYDVVILDIRMPGMNGMEVVHRLRGHLPPGTSTRIFAHTADADLEDRAYYRASGVDDVLAKPVRMADLVTTFGRWFPIPCECPSSWNREAMC